MKGLVERRPPGELSFKRRHGTGQKLNCIDQVRLEDITRIVKLSMKVLCLKRKGGKAKKVKTLF